MTTPKSDRPALADEVTSAHRTLRPLLEAASQQAPPDDARAALRSIDAFVVGMCEHLGAEADVLHPAARRLLDDGASAVAASVPCHKALQRQMRSLEQHLWGDARSAPGELEALRDDLASTFTEHARHDEALAARVDEAVEPEDRRRLVDDLRRAATRAPTRPHPHAPHRGPLAGPLRRLAGKWDDVLDTVDVRSAAGRRPPAPRRPLSLWSGYVVGRPPAADRPGADQGGADESRADHGGADEGGADQGGADQGGADQGGADSSGADSGRADQGGADRGGRPVPPV